MLLRQPQRNPRFGRGRARRDQILFGRYFLGEQPLLAPQIAARQRQPGAGRLDLALHLCRLAAFDDSQRIAPPYRLAQIAMQRDDPSADRRRHHLHALRIGLDRRGQACRPARSRHADGHQQYARATDLRFGQGDCPLLFRMILLAFLIMLFGVTRLIMRFVLRCRLATGGQ